MDVKKQTPMMLQWEACKDRAKDALLLFRMGDFYEAFYEDAEVLAESLELTLTKRQGVPMSGVPWHSAEGYIDRLVAKGYRVAVAEQTEDPKEAKGLVKREITRFVTPGTTLSASDSANNFMACVTQVGAVFGLASLDLSTGAFHVVEVENEGALISELARLGPSEFLTTERFKERHAGLFGDGVVSVTEEWQFEHKTAYAYLTDHFGVHHLDGFGLKGMVAAINAAGALLSYIHDVLALPIHHIRAIRPTVRGGCLEIDRITQHNLELTETVLKAIDQTKTAMGGRLLKQWLLSPLLSVEEIGRRQEGVAAFLEVPNGLDVVREQLKGVRDLERLIMKVETDYAGPRDLVALKVSLEQLPVVKRVAAQVGSEVVAGCARDLGDFSALTELLGNALVDEPPLRLTEGGIFREGYSEPLDELRQMARGGKEWLARYQETVRQEAGIKSLKVSFNRVFGYYIEVSKGQAHLMPETFQRRQTLVNAERFISPELKEYETKVLSAEEKMGSLEHDLFVQLRREIAKEAEAIRKSAEAVAILDVLQSFAEVARRHNYCRPEVDGSGVLRIEEGRHPVVERTLPASQFIPNETELGSDLMLITGPNMAGKSTYIRQVALIVILAQMGAYVPAKRAHVGVVDRVFTRIGASDDLARGQSTFMVEMSETAHILNNITPRSLVILDEIGRGTSTYDGVSIAWAVAEFLLKQEGVKTLFATHYFELTSLPGALNYHASVQEWNDEVVFLHKIVKGAADRSYGIHVARLAGLPFPVVARAQEILGKLEQSPAKREKRKGRQETQLSLFS